MKSDARQMSRAKNKKRLRRQRRWSSTCQMKSQSRGHYQKTYRNRKRPTRTEAHAPGPTSFTRREPGGRRAHRRSELRLSQGKQPITVPSAIAYLTSAPTSKPSAFIFACPIRCPCREQEHWQQVKRRRKKPPDNLAGDLLAIPPPTQLSKIPMCGPGNT